MKITNKIKRVFNPRVLSALFAVASVAQCFAAGNGMAGINEATSMISSYFDPGTKLIYAIGAVVGLIGGVKVYGKFSSGDPDTSKTAASSSRRPTRPEAMISPISASTMAATFCM